MPCTLTAQPLDCTNVSYTANYLNGTMRYTKTLNSLPALLSIDSYDIMGYGDIKYTTWTMVSLNAESRFDGTIGGHVTYVYEYQDDMGNILILDLNNRIELPEQLKIID